MVEKMEPALECLWQKLKVENGQICWITKKRREGLKTQHLQISSYEWRNGNLGRRM
jgi:hypothetical protein